MDKQENSLCSPKIGILDLNSDDRPREKLEAMGPHALSKAELLAILIGSGNAEENAVQLMQRLMADCDGQLNNLSRLTIEELCHYKGIGRAKAITLVAAMALAEERQREQNDVVKIQQAEDIYKYYRPRLGALTHEESHVLLLNQRLRVIGSKLVSRGGLTGTVVDVRMVLKAALLANATHIALCHITLREIRSPAAMMMNLPGNWPTRHEQSISASLTMSWWPSMASIAIRTRVNFRRRRVSLFS